jgi:hypothetical protein
MRTFKILKHHIDNADKARVSITTAGFSKEFQYITDLNFEMLNALGVGMNIIGTTSIDAHDDAYVIQYSIKDLS